MIPSVVDRLEDVGLLVLEAFAVELRSRILGERLLLVMPLVGVSLTGLLLLRERLAGKLLLLL